MGVNWHDKRVWWATSFVAWTLISIAERFPRNWSPACGGQVRLGSSIPTDSVERILSNALCRAAPFDVLVRSTNVAHLRAKLQCLAHACLWRAVGLRHGSPLRLGALLM